jgi:hypothetical protein
MLRGSLRLPYAAGSMMKKIGLQSVAEDIQAPLHSRIRRRVPPEIMIKIKERCRTVAGIPSMQMKNS